MLLCTCGRHLPYTFMFFPILRVADASSLDAMVNHAAQALAFLQRPPSQVHPAMWQTVQALTCNLIFRVVDLSAFAGIACSAAVVLNALALAEAPAAFVSVQLRAIWNSYRSRWLIWWQMYFRSLVASITAGVGAQPSTTLAIGSNIAGIVALVDMWMMIRFDHMFGILNNAVLGVELLQLAIQDCFPRLHWSGRMLTSFACVATGIYGVGRQLMSAGWLQPGNFAIRLKQQIRLLLTDAQGENEE